MNNKELIAKTVEITVAKMTNANTAPDEAGGKNVAAFMQEIYDKLSELNSREN